MDRFQHLRENICWSLSNKAVTFTSRDSVFKFTKPWDVPSAISTDVFGAPTGAFVTGSVVWYRKAAGIEVAGLMEQFVAIPGPMLITIAKGVAVVPTCTDGLFGSTIDTSSPKLTLGATQVSAATIQTLGAYDCVPPR